MGKEMLWERSWREPPLPWQGQQADERLVLGAAPWETSKLLLNRMDVMEKAVLCKGVELGVL